MQSAIRFSSLNLRSRKWYFNGVSKRCFFIHDLNRKDERIEVSQYWGLVSKGKLPWNSYEARDNKDGSVDLKAHHKPEVFVDKLAFLIVKLLRIPTDLFFKKHYGCRAVMLETIAGVPGMVAGMLLHLRSLRRIEHTGGWIKALLEEAENERMHLMTFMEIYQPKWHERAIVVSVQFIAFTGYLIVYSAYPRLAHRVVAYLEEEAIHSYTDYLEELDSGRMPNIPAPPIAIDYWNLSKDATLRDVVVAVRADEAHHRDVNHFAADIHKEKKKLKEAPIRG